MCGRRIVAAACDEVAAPIARIHAAVEGQEFIEQCGKFLGTLGLTHLDARIDAGFDGRLRGQRLGLRQRCGLAQLLQRRSNSMQVRELAARRHAQEVFSQNIARRQCGASVQMDDVLNQPDPEAAFDFAFGPDLLQKLRSR